MNKIKNIFLILLFGVIALLSCEDNNRGFVNPYADLNYEELAVSDHDSIVKFLKNNYYDVSLDSIKTLVDGKIAMFEETDKLDSITVTQNDIDQILYVYIVEKGQTTPKKKNPTVMDSVYVKYSGRAFQTSNLEPEDFEKNENGVWFTLNNVIKGWSHGFTLLKGGELKKEANGDPFNGPITFLNTGKGILFLPSGLAYPSSNTNNFNNRLINTNLMFTVELLDLVEDTDHDNDGVPSIEEDANGDGDPTNDFSDNSNPNLPDYLNPNV
jgi:hypothetical protein